MPALSCGKLYVPPVTPDYADDCTPSHTEYLDAAASTVDIDAVGEVPADADAAIAYCRQVIQGRGWSLVEKGDASGSQWGDFTTTLGNLLPVILLGVDWQDKSKAAQAITICHEAVHTFTWDRMGDGKFLATYAINEGTWSIEVPAYRMSLRLWVALSPGLHRNAIEAKAHRYAETLVKKYKLNNMPETCAVEGAVEIMMRDHK